MCGWTGLLQDITNIAPAAGPAAVDANVQLMPQCVEWTGKSTGLYCAPGVANIVISNTILAYWSSWCLGHHVASNCFQWSVSMIELLGLLQTCIPADYCKLLSL